MDGENQQAGGAETVASLEGGVCGGRGGGEDDFAGIGNDFRNSVVRIVGAGMILDNER